MPRKYVVYRCGREPVADQKPEERGHKCAIGLIKNASGVQHPVCILTVYGYVMGNQPLCSISHILVSLEMALLNHIQPIVKLEGEGTLLASVFCTVCETTSGRHGDIHPEAMDSNICKWCLFGGIRPPIKKTPDTWSVRSVELAHKSSV